MAEPEQLRLAVAQTVLREDPRDSAGLRDSGRDIRRLMRKAHEAGAALVHFPEGVTCSPHKRVMSVEGPDKVGPADWNRFEWNVLRQELAAIAEAARALRLWTVLGSVHRLTPPHRPHNSLYVISDRGEVVTRYVRHCCAVESTRRPGSCSPRRRSSPVWEQVVVAASATGAAIPRAVVTAATASAATNPRKFRDIRVPSLGKSTGPTRPESYIRKAQPGDRAEPKPLPRNGIGC
ncbi:nitrilase-related carbon-nitrogen hydrolase [Amycolatopsis mongoliensis]|uniref:Nitrilase-related carbon-nitrogen hydrolase n=1 Tax=Amycolatopsis mongoliensis TaxID=715475 RepID=A0A9Y2JQC0_9PSEU|nr:nitrilase-related carbon-nitrogen hydrolase [Amycolatopsis sp. 4-36]WIY01054.1 nitrilase-related carbon-nitrogen hydrolase [Amycolatopsis sp. 4-36]